MEPSKLNDDQRAAIKSLPALEATVKELSEVKKAVEVCCIILSLLFQLLERYPL